MYREAFGAIEELEDAELNFRDSYIGLQSGSDEVLELYHGHFASSATPMSRFTTISPANDTHPWLARDALEEAGIGYGDLETIEVRQLASELMAAEESITDGRDSEGSPRPSSDTLSITQLRKMRSKKKGPRVRKRIMIRKRDTKRVTGTRSTQAEADGSIKVGASDESMEK